MLEHLQPERSWNVGLEIPVDVSQYIEIAVPGIGSFFEPQGGG
jgi:hypothetical protein